MTLRIAKRTQVKWNKIIPIKINVHSWRFSRDRLPTRPNIDARGIKIDALRCPPCDECTEYATHLFVVTRMIQSEKWRAIQIN
ncbi:hypothetical protein CTI12_AA539820 [Artemisia annua]|uniref:Reverse transcriptase zinc-binding domain-containing protein n=1 Tax=Artemisia annua TaxID=35608 RepID=A0A2U1L200_ARTAN|nr:hypothetical protein CTI12_AA539820 [Artemisia annua]